MSNFTTWDPRSYNQQHGFVANYGLEVIKLLAPQPQERILDLGCGTGPLTAEISQHCAKVVGIDNAASMIEAARQSYPEIEFVVADAQNFSFEIPFDAVFSNAALHWLHNPKAAIDCVWNVLKPGGRFVAEMGGYGNVQTILSSIVQAAAKCGVNAAFSELANYFPKLSQYTTLLEERGMRVMQAFHFDRPTPLEEGDAGLRNWIKMFRRQVLDGMSADKQEQFLTCVEDIARPDLFHDGRWFADYRRLRFYAVKEISPEFPK